MKVSVSINREVPQVKGYRRFIVLGTYSKALNMAESMSGGMEADFRHLVSQWDRKAFVGGETFTQRYVEIYQEILSS
uniref:Uncharacterized protein n=1 Tax=Hucho hucho TaxID=62062 RepID=A0A4W5R4P9_9TELE